MSLLNETHLFLLKEHFSIQNPICPSFSFGFVYYFCGASLRPLLKTNSIFIGICAFLQINNKCTLLLTLPNVCKFCWNCAKSQWTPDFTHHLKREWPLVTYSTHLLQLLLPFFSFSIHHSRIDPDKRSPPISHRTTMNERRADTTFTFTHPSPPPFILLL